MEHKRCQSSLNVSPRWEERLAQLKSRPHEVILFEIRAVSVPFSSKLGNCPSFNAMIPPIVSGHQPLKIGCAERVARSGRNVGLT
jgi:hypothetical protein